MWSKRATAPAWRRCSPPYSFYHNLIGRYWAGGPSEQSGAPIHRICTLARKMGARSLIVEDVLARPDVADEISHLESHAPVTSGDVTAAALTFLTSGVRKAGDTRPIQSARIIGQVVIITFPDAGGPKSYVFEAIIRLPSRGSGNEQLLNNHVPIATELELTVDGQAHSIPSAYFCQQNGITSICPHSAVRTLVRTCTKDTVTVRQLNDCWKFDPAICRVNTMQMADALQAFGLRPIQYNLVDGKSPVDKAWDLFALLADSASPSLLILSTGNRADHVVPIIGHTFNSDEWHPLGQEMHKDGQANVSSSSMWTDHLVMHDDVLGPYYCLSRAGLQDCAGKGVSPKMAIAVLPKGVEVSPSQAEDFARQIVGNVVQSISRAGMGQGRWWQHLVKARERRVFRTTLIDKDAYLRSLPHPERSERDAFAASLPDRFWMAEISLPNLFLANRAKLGELLISPNQLPADDQPGAVLSTLLGFRLPSVLGWASQSGHAGRFDAVDWPETSHRRIYAPHQHQNWW